MPFQRNCSLAPAPLVEGWIRGESTVRLTVAVAPLGSAGRLCWS